MRLHRATLIAALAAAGLTACSDRVTTAPETAALGKAGENNVPPVDTTKPPPTSFRVVGQILGVSARAAAAGSSDTLRFDPIVGAKIRIWRNILVEGKARQVLAAETTSGANGAYRVEGLAGGYYIVKAAAPAGSPFGDNWEYLAGFAPEVRVNVYLWRRP